MRTTLPISEALNEAVRRATVGLTGRRAAAAATMARRAFAHDLTVAASKHHAVEEARAQLPTCDGDPGRVMA